MLVAALLIIPACNRNESERVRASSSGEPTTEQMKQQRDQYVKNVDAKLAEFDQKFDGLDERAKALRGPAQGDLKNAVDQLRDQRKTVTRKLDDLKSVSIDSWMTLKTE